MLELYLQGLSFRNIGRQIGRSDRYVRLRFIRQPGHYDLVSSVLIGRITHARNKRQRKHSISMLRRHRPQLYARWLEEQLPGLRGVERFGRQWKGICPNCLTHNAYVEGKPDAWRWRCYSCDESGDAARTKPNDMPLEESGS